MHYTKVKNNWSVAITVLKITGISVTCVLAGGAILAVAPFNLPIVAGILGLISLIYTGFTNLLVEGFTSKRKRYFRQKCNHIKEYLNKMEVFFIKCKEDGQVSHDEFNMFQKLLKEYEDEIHMSVKVKSKDIKKAKKMAKKELRQRNLNQLYNSILQDQQRKLK